MSHWIDFRLVGERKDIGWEKYSHGRLRVARRLGEAVIKTAAAGPRYVREHAVESDATILIGVEALIQKVAQESSVLRDAFAEDAGRRRDGIRRVLCV